MTGQSYAMFGCSWTAVSVLGCQVFRQALMDSCDIHPISVSHKKKRNGEGVGCWGNSVFVSFDREVGWIITGGWLTLSSNWQPTRLFLRIYSQFASFFKCTIKCLVSYEALERMATDRWHNSLHDIKSDWHLKTNGLASSLKYLYIFPL